MLILVRHGRTELNAAARLQGRLDIPLDDVGRDQAARVAAKIGPVARVVASPLVRAVQTADAFGLPVEIDARWLELDYGEYDGMKLRDVPSHLWDKWRNDPDFTPPGGESMRAMHERVIPACEELLAQSADRDIVIVSHVSPIKAVVAWAMGCGIEASWRTWMDQASISRIGLGPRGPMLRSFNESA